MIAQILKGALRNSLQEQMLKQTSIETGNQEKCKQNGSSRKSLAGTPHRDIPA